MMGLRGWYTAVLYCEFGNAECEILLKMKANLVSMNKRCHPLELDVANVVINEHGGAPGGIARQFKL